MRFRDCYEKYEKQISKLFERYGELVSKYPLVFLIGCLIVNSLLGIGLVRMETENDVETLYTPMNSQAQQDRNQLRELYEDKTGTNFRLENLADLGLYGEIIIQTKSGDSILEEKYFAEIERINNHILTSVSFEDESNSKLYYEDTCARQNGSCYISGISVLSQSFRNLSSVEKITYPQIGQQFISQMFGNVSVSNGILKFATMVKLRYNLNQNTTQTQSRSRQWENAFLYEIKSLKSNSTNIIYATSGSLNQELDKNTQGDIIYFSLTFTLMITYASLATIGGDCVSDRSHLGRAGVLATVLAILGSFGLVSACGVKFVNIVGVMPFLVIGEYSSIKVRIGLDDMFLLMSGLAEVTHLETVPEKIKKTMVNSGVAITITSVTDCLAFGIGASSVFYSVRNFCIYTGVAIIFCYLNQLTFTTACLVIHERRSEKGRSCVTCQKVKPREDLRTEGKSQCFVFCCGGSPAKNRSDVDNPLEKYPLRVLKKIVVNKLLKVIILILFFAYLGVSIWGTINLKQGLDLKDLVSKDSYFYTYSSIDQEFFSTEISVSFVIKTEQNYSQQDIQLKVNDLLTKAKKDNDIYSSFEINWLKDYMTSSVYDPTSHSTFVNGLKTFLQYRPDLDGDIAFDTNGTKIKSSRFHILSKSIKQSSDQGKFMLRMRDIASSSALPCFSYSPPFIFFEQYVTILANTLQTLGIAVGVMLFVTTVFMPHPLLVILVTTTMVMIIVGICGFMHFWGLTLSSVTMIHIIMSVGFSVDFSAHICHGYIVENAETRDERVKAAITRSGGPILNAAVSSVLGILMLIFSNSFIFQSFFKLMLLVILFGLAHSIFFLPVILSLIGPMNTHTSTLPQDEPSLSSRADTLQEDELALDNSLKIIILNIEEFDFQSEIGKIILKRKENGTHVSIKYPQDYAVKEINENEATKSLILTSNLSLIGPINEIALDEEPRETLFQITILNIEEHEYKRKRCKIILKHKENEKRVIIKYSEIYAVTEINENGTIKSLILKSVLPPIRMEQMAII
ncbi:hypothetical protein KUTeg_007413 [Tegillarca granosa]|uniref:SSD domain-containing protein n=1 Tax=Tegillarca granosa TaxID=220873 RepID=A0ABQ9FD65_TEGGR|nr:hypothetical protein KUTeg_007413 [Tegillarca granosa]